MKNSKKAAFFLTGVILSVTACSTEDINGSFPLPYPGSQVSILDNNTLPGSFKQLATIGDLQPYLPEPEKMAQFSAGYQFVFQPAYQKKTVEAGWSINPFGFEINQLANSEISLNLNGNKLKTTSEKIWPLIIDRIINIYFEGNIRVSSLDKTGMAFYINEEETFVDLGSLGKVPAREVVIDNLGYRGIGAWMEHPGDLSLKNVEISSSSEKLRLFINSNLGIVKADGSLIYQVPNDTVDNYTEMTYTGKFKPVIHDIDVSSKPVSNNHSIKR
jgi:hypothetical protein